MTTRALLTLSFLLAATTPALAQQADSLQADSPDAPPSLAAQDSLILSDSLPTFPLTTSAQVGLPRTPAAQTDGEGLDQPITFSSADSLVLLFSSEDDTSGDGDIGTLFGSAQVGYDEASLTAAEIDLLFGREELRARGPTGTTVATDSLGDPVGTPYFERGEESLSGREVAYNLSTQRGRIVGARTAIEDGYLLGGVIKQIGPHITYAKDATYTTCEHDEPHYGLRAGEMKVVDGEWVYTGPARLYILGVPTPLWLPFGFFPAAEGRRSGPLPPTYGEDPQLGFYLRGLGWYWAISDYMDATVRGAIWTKGSFEVNPSYRYAKRYAFSGNLNVAYARLRRGERQDPTFSLQKNVRVGWQHQQQLFNNTASLNGSVDLASTGYLRAISDDFDDRVTRSTQSSIRFNKNWRRSGRSLSLDLNQRQDLVTGGATLTFPNLSFRQSERFPLRRAGTSAQNQRWYERISYRYDGTLQNTYTFTPQNDTLLTESEQSISWLDGIFDYDDFVAATGETARFDARASHTVPVSASFSLTRVPFTSIPFNLNLTPNATYEEDWYPRSTRFLTDADGVVIRDTTTNRLAQVQEDGFTAIRQVSAGLRANSTFYGTFPVRVGPLDGFRHIVRPSLGYTFSPDYSKGPFNYFRSYIDEEGEVVEYPIVSGISAQERQALSFSLANTFQTRIARTDSTGEVQRRAVQFLSLNLSSNYNIAADSLRLAPVSLTANSRLGSVALNLTARYSPYALNDQGRQIDRLQFDETGGLLRFLAMSFSASTRFRPQPRRGATPRTPRRRVPVYPDLIATDRDAYGLRPYDYRRRDLDYVDFAIPWSLSLNFSYSDTAVPNQENRVQAALDAQFDLSLTSNWKIAGRSGYDFEEKEITTTNLSILRDLHCWEMSFNWIPFGDFKSFGFSIYVKSGQLADLLRFDVPKRDVGGRFDLAGGL